LGGKQALPAREIVSKTGWASPSLRSRGLTEPDENPDSPAAFLGSGRGGRGASRAHTAAAGLKPVALTRRAFLLALPGGASFWSCLSNWRWGVVGIGRKNLAAHRCSHLLW